MLLHIPETFSTWELDIGKQDLPFYEKDSEITHRKQFVLYEYLVFTLHWEASGIAKLLSIGNTIGLQHNSRVNFLKIRRLRNRT